MKARFTTDPRRDHIPVFDKYWVYIDGCLDDIPSVCENYIAMHRPDANRYILFKNAKIAFNYAAIECWKANTAMKAQGRFDCNHMLVPHLVVERGWWTMLWED